MRARQLIYALFIATLVAMPSLLMLGYHRLSGDPSFRPLAQTIEAAILGGAAAENDLMQVHLRLHQPTREQGLRIARQLYRSLSAKGVNARVLIFEASALERASVTFVVGRNLIGPYPLSRASNGINAAVSAYRAGPRGADDV